MSIKKVLSCVIFVFACFMCASVRAQTKKHILVVFVHGTILPWVPYIYTYQPFGRDGLHDISYDPDYIIAHPTAFVSALLYEKMGEFIYSSDQDTYSFCTFSWNGHLKARQRACSADNLYHALLKKIKVLQAKYPDRTIEVHVLGHSHGGNVILNLPVSERKFGKHLVIDKAILLGTPVQRKTERFVYSPLFKNVYNFYSYGDFVQVLDVLSGSDISSRRRFGSQEKLCVKNARQANVKQIDVKIGGDSPRHNELWCFGGSGNYLYRDDLITAPLPLFIFMPVIIDFIDRYMKKATLMSLRIDRQASSYKFSCADRQKLPRKYKYCYSTMSFDDIMLDFFGDHMVHELRSAFRLVGFELN